MDYVDEIHPHDEVVESNGARVMIAPMAQMFLFGTEIDYADRADRIGLPVQQPQRRRGLRLRRVDQVRRHAEVAVSAATRAFVLELFEDLGGVTARADDGRAVAPQRRPDLRPRRPARSASTSRRPAASPPRSRPRAASSSPTRAPARHRPHGLLDPARRRPRRPRGRLRLGAPRARRLIARRTLPPARRLC